MSEQDQDRMVGRIVKGLAGKLFFTLVIPIFVILIAAKAWDRQTENKKADGLHTEIYNLTAELSTTLSMYMKANDQDKVEIGKRIDYILERMDKYSYNDPKRGTVQDEKRNYGLEFTPLI